MATIPIPSAKGQRPKEDPHFAAAVERAREAVRQLQEAGVIDEQGRRVRTDLPSDMQETKDLDFGG